MDVFYGGNAVLSYPDRDALVGGVGRLDGVKLGAWRQSALKPGLCDDQDIQFLLIKMIYDLSSFAFLPEASAVEGGYLNSGRLVQVYGGLQVITLLDAGSVSRRLRRAVNTSPFTTDLGVSGSLNKV